ncbi:MAG: hypothetical protein VXY05_01345 [Pseudomonadota bacterium]|nr:hypothetical protein [Pseudomonadota bacterium]
MKILKISVLVMGFLIVGLTLVVVVTIANRWDETKPLAKQEGPTLFSQPYKSAIRLPVGSKVISTDVGDGQLFIRVEKLDGKQFIFVVDAMTGIKTGTLNLF